MQIPSDWKKLFITVSFLLAVFLLAAAPATRPGAAGSNTPLFLPVVNYDSGSTVSAVVADVNGDGKPDVLVANADSNTVSVLLGNGDGTFQAATTYGSGGLNAYSIVVADVNGDGKPDAIVGNADDSTVGVLLGNGNGTFQPAVTYSSGGFNLYSLAAADMNGDGKPDLVVVNEFLVGVLLGNGDGTFQAVVTYGTGGLFAHSLAVADVSGDGKPDLLVSNESANGCTGGAVGVLLGNGDGTLQSAVTYCSGAGNAWSVAVGDLNGDGKLDLAVGHLNPQEDLVGVLLGNGDGTFQPAQTFDSGGFGAWRVAVADVNGDARPDLLVANRYSDSVAVLLGNGDGTFQPALSYNAGGEVWSVAVADVNGDGKPDVVVANCGTGPDCGLGTVGVLLNNTVDTTPPVITLSITPKVLWPPNGNMVSVIVSGTITDTGSGVSTNSAAYAVKDEYGEVQPAGAIGLGSGGGYSFTVLLQASRLGSDLDGRRYTVTVRAKDNAGNRGSKTSAVTVPHDQGHSIR